MKDQSIMHLRVQTIALAQTTALVIILASVFTPVNTALAGAWENFCAQEKNRSLCVRANAQCELSQSLGVSCGEIQDVYMRYRGFSSAHLKHSREEDRKRENAVE